MTTAAAAEYPARPIRFIVPQAPGGASDINARLLVTELSKQMGQQIVVDNRPGASTIIGTELVAKAAPDGYTIGQPRRLRVVTVFASTPIFSTSHSTRSPCCRYHVPGPL